MYRHVILACKRPSVSHSPSSSLLVNILTGTGSWLDVAVAPLLEPIHKKSLLCAIFYSFPIGVDHMALTTPTSQQLVDFVAWWVLQKALTWVAYPIIMPKQHNPRAKYFDLSCQFRVGMIIGEATKLSLLAHPCRKLWAGPLSEFFTKQHVLAFQACFT